MRNQVGIINCVPEFDSGAQIKPKVDAIRMMTTLTSLLASPDAASINSRQMNDYKIVLGFTSNS